MIACSLGHWGRHEPRYTLSIVSGLIELVCCPRLCRTVLRSRLLEGHVYVNYEVVRVITGK